MSILSKLLDEQKAANRARNQKEIDKLVVAQRTANATYVAEVSDKKKTSHLFHLILTVLTGGFWGIIWILMMFRNTTSNVVTKHSATKKRNKDISFDL